MAKVQTRTGEAPQYVLTERAYINDTLYEVGCKIEYDGAPGHHMQPNNAAAREMKSLHDKEYIDPIEALCDIGATAQ